MTDQEINIAIAEACGWTYVNRYGGRTKHATWAKWKVRNPEENQNSHDLPNFCDDLNAMHEAEKVLSPLCRAEYAIALADITNRRGVELDYVGATARQRAEAFLRTLGKWPVTEQAALDKSPPA